MDREILFRGKRTDNGEWLEGYYAKSGGSFILQDNGLTYGGFEMFDVVPETVCKYTGLTDKNGKQIFEGDIVETVYDGQQNPNYVVVWDEDDLDFKATNGKRHYKDHFEYLGCCDEIIVIGNIFDSPDLLKGDVE